MPGLRVVLDTNVLVSGLAYPGSVPGRIVAVWRQGGMEVADGYYGIGRTITIPGNGSKMRLTFDVTLYADVKQIMPIVQQASVEQVDGDVRATSAWIRCIPAAICVVGSRGCGTP